VEGRLHTGLEGALSWVLDEPMARTSHALCDGGKVWLVDPVDWAPAMEAVASLGEPVAVLQLLDRHNRDNTEIAARLGVPVLRNPLDIPDAPFSPVPLIDRRWWHETVVWWSARQLLVVPEAVGSAPAFAVGPGKLGVHPMLRLRPPSRLRSFAPEHLLPGHGDPVHGDAAAELRAALDRTRRDVPALVRRLPGLIRGH